jgi:TrmH family RNA methyltransferase
MLLDGFHLVQAYVDGFGVAGVKLIARASNAAQPEVQAWLNRAPDGAVILQDRLFDELSGVETPVGLLAAVPIPREPSKIPATDGFTVFLDGIQDPGNLGAILRSAAAAGGQAAVLSRQCADPWSPKSLRGGMGAQFLIRIVDRADLAAVLPVFPGRILAMDARGAVSVFRSDLSGPVGFLFGSEGIGIAPALLQLAAQRLRIPMASGVESLNVGAAAAVCFFEWKRRRSDN